MIIRFVAEDLIAVRVVGDLRTGVGAIGGESTGTTITAKGITWELNLGKRDRFRKAAKLLSGKKVFVEGSLERRRGVEIKERWIVTVSRLRSAKDDAAKGKAYGGSKPVRAKVVFGLKPGKVDDKRIEDWVYDELARAGSFYAEQHSSWINLTDESQRLYSSKQGGFIIYAHYSRCEELYRIEIDACAGYSLDQVVTLRPGDQRIVNITGGPAPLNTFVVLSAPEDGKTAETESTKTTLIDTGSIDKSPAKKTGGGR